MTFRDRELLRSLTSGIYPNRVFGLLFGKFILENLFDTLFVGLSFIVGALLMLHVEFLHRQEKQRVNSVRNVSKNNAMKIGLVQTLALIPALVGQVLLSLGGCILA